MKINIAYDQPLSQLPAGFTQGIDAQVQFFEKNFTDNVEFTIHVGYGEDHGQSIGGALATNLWGSDVKTDYTQLSHAFAANATSAIDHQVAASLPSFTLPIGGSSRVFSAENQRIELDDPTNGGHFHMSPVEAAALGLHSGPIDVYMGFNNKGVFDFDPSNGITAGKFDFQGAVAHEISELMGRHLDVGQDGSYSPMDLMHYSAPGVRDFSGTTPGYFSYDGGKTNLGQFNTAAGIDPGDFKAGIHDPFGVQEPGQVYNITPADMQIMDALGYHRTPLIDFHVPHAGLDSIVLQPVDLPHPPHPTPGLSPQLHNVFHALGGASADTGDVMATIETAQDLSAQPAHAHATAWHSFAHDHFNAGSLDAHAGYNVHALF